MRRQTYFADQARSPPYVMHRLEPSPPRVHGPTRFVFLTPTHAPSLLPPPPETPTMTVEEEERLIWAVMEDFEREYKGREEEEWQGLEHMLALLATDDVYMPKLDVKVEVKEKVMKEAALVWPPSLY
ncbi:hypothetical protein D1007_53951 [Hordeum vulgare]|nr:hypothetical protein D1007_53951 [Hordeum vulgare]